jgi:hypothetical protein
MEKSSSSSSTLGSSLGAYLTASLGFSATLAALGAYPAPDIYLNL